MVICEESEMVYFTSSVMKNIVALFSRFLVKTICCITFESASLNAVTCFNYFLVDDQKNFVH